MFLQKSALQQIRCGLLTISDWLLARESLQGRRAESLGKQRKPMIPRGSAVLPAGGPVTAWKRPGTGHGFRKNNAKKLIKQSVSAKSSLTANPMVPAEDQ